MDIVISIASKIAESLVTPIGREFGYLIYYDTKMKDLKGELKQLFDMKDGVQKLVKAAKRNGGVINSDVQSWLTSVNELIQKVSHFEEEVNMKRQCLYRWNMRTFNNVAHPAPPPMISSTFKEGFKDFKSRMTSVNRVIEVLKNEEVRMIGICGMGGVGKTTMVKEIIKRLEGLKRSWGLHITRIPIMEEVAPTNLDQDSNDYNNLERLDVGSCESLEVVFQLKGPEAVESHNVQAFNKLCYLSLYKLPSLMHVWKTGGSQHITGFGNLTFLSVSRCGSLRYLFLSTIAKLLVSLKDLEVLKCEKMEQVIAKADTECADQEITFPQLNSMTLEDLPNLICFSTEAYTL
ncbi:putative disease resistance protein [Prunus yedoensis var. nudiflora]|uniref:Putative disease resistance protein n=1 Tax=Prunus yedoensis var. nudiflora TaxID=2094558 RepID=A0A314YNG2_PRUYE|nr:putative disease resistance protein [Prunus yedoensis var. nudiflora]